MPINISSSNNLLRSYCLHFNHIVVSPVKELNTFGTHSILFILIYMSYVLTL